MRALSTSRLAAKAIQRPGPAVVPACQLLSSSSRSLAPKPPTSLAYSPLESEEFKAAYTQTREKWEPTAEASEAAGGPSARPHYSQRPRAPRTPRFAQQQSTAPATRSSDPRFNSDGQPRGSRSSDPRPSHNGQPRAPKFPRPETTPLEHLLTLADLTPSQIDGMVRYAMAAKWIFYNRSLLNFPDTLAGRSIAMIFAKRSTRTRVSAESAIHLLGGNPMFLGKDDIQLGVNESMRDSATVIGSMSDGILARVNAHEDVEMLARYSPVPVINALSDLYHPLQILADLQTMVENIRMPPLRSLKSEVGNPEYGTIAMMSSAIGPRSRLFSVLAGKKFAWVGDTNNITNELMVTLPRFGAQMVVASPKGYDQVDPRVMAVLKQHGTESLIEFTNDPKRACEGADYIATDTWTSMGQEAETAARKKAFQGFQVTKEMCAGANPGWIFMHCLPRHQEEVDDEIFYGKNSLVFPQAENRKWTALSAFHGIYRRGITARIDAMKAAADARRAESMAQEANMNRQESEADQEDFEDVGEGAHRAA